MSEPNWVSADELIEINREEVFETGETHFLRDRGLLESAASRPRNLWALTGETDTVVLAVALLMGIARNHPFEQGNKRTAYVAAIQFLEVNGFEWLPEADQHPVEDWIVFAINRDLSEERLADLVRPFVRPQE